jgi:hypothetical protein
MEALPNSFKSLKFEQVSPVKGTLRSFSIPDSSAIEALVDKLYPQLLSRHAPCPGSLDQCAECNIGEAQYSCSDCFTLQWYCKACIVKMHSCNPFHRVHRWSKEQKCKESTALVDLGLTIRLVHEDGKSCTSTGNYRDLQVMHLNGFHRVKYQQCDCDISQTHSASPKRLMANGLFPATFASPAVAFTFQILTFFDILNLYGHVNIKQFCDSIISNVPEDLKRQEDVS